MWIGENIRRELHVAAGKAETGIGDTARKGDQRVACHFQRIARAEVGSAAQHRLVPGLEAPEAAPGGGADGGAECAVFKVKMRAVGSHGSVSGVWLVIAAIFELSARLVQLGH